MLCYRFKLQRSTQIKAQQNAVEDFGSFTCEEEPEVVGFYRLLVATATRLPVFDLVGGDDAVLRAAWRWLPRHLDALKRQSQAAG